MCGDKVGGGARVGVAGGEQVFQGDEDEAVEGFDIDAGVGALSGAFDAEAEVDEEAFDGAGGEVGVKGAGSGGRGEGEAGDDGGLCGGLGGGVADDGADEFAYVGIGGAEPAAVGCAEGVAAGGFGMARGDGRVVAGGDLDAECEASIAAGVGESAEQCAAFQGGVGEGSEAGVAVEVEVGMEPECTGGEAGAQFAVGGGDHPVVGGVVEEDGDSVGADFAADEVEGFFEAFGGEFPEAASDIASRAGHGWSPEVGGFGR